MLTLGLLRTAVGSALERAVRRALGQRDALGVDSEGDEQGLDACVGIGS